MDEEVLRQLIKRLLEQDPVVRASPSHPHFRVDTASRLLNLHALVQDMTRLREVAAAHGA